MPALRGDQIGSLVAAAFGLIYVQVNTDTLPAAVAWPLRVLALVAVVSVVVGMYRRRNRTGGRPGGGRGFGRPSGWSSSWRSWRSSGGCGCLAGPLDRPEAGVAWVSLVVGVHFFALAVVFREPFFHLLGAAITACGALGLALALADVGQVAVDTVSGVVPGFLLLGFAWWGVQRDRSGSGPPLATASDASA